MTNKLHQVPVDIVVHGIANCDTVRRSRHWLTANGIAHRFHDFKKCGVPPDALANWIDALGWERLLNRQGTTWRKLDDEVKASITDASSAAALMLEQASVIKRPLVRWGDGEFTVGFDDAEFARRIAA